MRLKRALTAGTALAAIVLIASMPAMGAPASSMELDLSLCAPPRQNTFITVRDFNPLDGSSKRSGR
jgi:hypothetical protein